MNAQGSSPIQDSGRVGWPQGCLRHASASALSADNSVHCDENRDSPERDMVNPSTDSYMWPIRDTH